MEHSTLQIEQKQNGPRKTIPGGHTPCSPSACWFFTTATYGFYRQISPEVTQTHFLPGHPNPSSQRAGEGQVVHQLFPSCLTKPANPGRRIREQLGRPRVGKGLAQGHPESQQQSWDRKPHLLNKRNKFEGD